MAQDETRELILDMNKISFIDSGGARGITQLENDTEERNLSVLVEPSPEKIGELLRVTGLSGRLGAGPERGRGVLDSFIDRAEITLPRDPRTPARARAEVREVAGDLDGDQRGVVALLTSELVTNAVIHAPPAAGRELRLLISTAPGRFRVEVLGPGKGFDPQRPEPRRPEQGGRGLMLVDQLASRWGAGPVDPELDGAPVFTERGPVFSVWFELDLDGRPSADVARSD